MSHFTWKKFLNLNLIAVSITVFWILATPALALDHSDQEAIRNTIETWVNAWNKNDIHTLKDAFDERALMVASSGLEYSGKDAIAERHALTLTTWLKTRIGL